MADDKTEIRSLIERWASAVHDGDLEAALADHAEDIVMFDVPPPKEVAFAHALLRCGTPEELEKDPDNRLRLTLGRRKQGGRWVLAHEHHSFPDQS